MSRTLTEEELGKIVKKLVEEGREEQEAALESKSSLVKFLEEIGLAVIADKISKLVTKVWNKFVEAIASWL